MLVLTSWMLSPRDNFQHCLINAAHQFLNKQGDEFYILAGYKTHLPVYLRTDGQHLSDSEMSFIFWQDIRGLNAVRAICLFPCRD